MKVIKTNDYIGKDIKILTNNSSNIKKASSEVYYKDGVDIYFSSVDMEVPVNIAFEYIPSEPEDRQFGYPGFGGDIIIRNAEVDLAKVNIEELGIGTPDVTDIIAEEIERNNELREELINYAQSEIEYRSNPDI